MTKNESLTRPPTHHIRAMAAAAWAYYTNAQCWLSEEGMARVSAEYECPGEGWGATPAEVHVAEQLWHSFWAANAL